MHGIGCFRIWAPSAKTKRAGQAVVVTDFFETIVEWSDDQILIHSKPDHTINKSKMRFGSTRFLNHGITALVGVIAGVCYERSNGFSGLVLHATALEKSDQFKPYLNPIPTVPDGNRKTTTIMRHGFPTFENVRLLCSPIRVSSKKLKILILTGSKLQ